jgi:hypothetical protein
MDFKVGLRRDRTILGYSSKGANEAGSQDDDHLMVRERSQAAG